MDETLWSGWLQKRGADSSGIAGRLTFMNNVLNAYKERYFVLDSSEISYYAPPGNSPRDSLYIDKPSNDALLALGFSKKGSIALADIVNIRRSNDDKCLEILTKSGRIFEVEGIFDSNSSLNLASFESCLTKLKVNSAIDMNDIYNVSGSYYIVA